MISVPAELWRKFGGCLRSAGVPDGEWGEYREWLRSYLDFCHKCGYGCGEPGSLEAVLSKPALKKQSVSQQRQAG